MTKAESKRLDEVTEMATRMDERQKDMKDDIEELKKDVKSILRQLQHNDSRYVSRAELKLTQWVVGVAISLSVLAIAIFDKFRSH